VSNWSRYLARLFDLARVEGGHSHRFRDTCAVELLLAGASVEDVAMILGNTPQVVAKHYAPWVSERQIRLEKAGATELAVAGAVSCFATGCRN
jgi:hypothetical protein